MEFHALALLDGSMVLVVEPPPETEDKRKGKVLSWPGVRLNQVHPHGSLSPRVAGHVAGGVEDSGRPGWRGAAKAGFGRGSPLPAVGDGALWMVNQRELQWGTQGGYWVECFARWESLGNAAKVCAPAHPQAWVEVQQDRLKANQVAAVLYTWVPVVRADNSAAPVTAGDRYLRNCVDHLDSPGALQRGLPMGSKEINRERAPLS